jgi:hypothetical protein
MANKIIINGTTITGDFTGGVSIRNGVVSIGGKVVQTNVSGEVHIKWEGPLTNLDTDGSATVSGDVHGSVTAGGSVNCGAVGKAVDAGGSVQCSKVGGSINAGGSVSVR